MWAFHFSHWVLLHTDLPKLKTLIKLHLSSVKTSQNLDKSLFKLVSGPLCKENIVCRKQMNSQCLSWLALVFQAHSCDGAGYLRHKLHYLKDIFNVMYIIGFFISLWNKTSLPLKKSSKELNEQQGKKWCAPSPSPQYSCTSACGSREATAIIAYMHRARLNLVFSEIFSTLILPSGAVRKQNSWNRNHKTQETLEL